MPEGRDSRQRFRIARFFGCCTDLSDVDDSKHVKGVDHGAASELTDRRKRGGISFDSFKPAQSIAERQPTDSREASNKVAIHGAVQWGADGKREACDWRKHLPAFGTVCRHHARHSSPARHDASRRLGVELPWNEKDARTLKSPSSASRALK